MISHFQVTIDYPVSADQVESIVACSLKIIFQPIIFKLNLT